MRKTIYLIFTIMSICVTGFAQDFTGKWKFETTIKEFGHVEFLLDFDKTSDTSFFASSRPEALKDVLSGFKYALVKRNVIFKNGSLIHIYKGKIKNDTLTGVFTTPMGNYNFEASFRNDKMIGELFGNNRDELSFEFTAIPYNENRLDYDYVSLINEIKMTFHDNIYDYRILEQKRWRKFFAKLDKLAPKIADDLEMFTYFSFLSKDLKMSHVFLVKYNQWDNYDENDTSGYESQVSHKMLNENTAYIKFDGFQLADTTVVRSFFKLINDKQTPYLIMDFRGCGGGDYSSMFLASYLVKESYDAGFFVGNKYFQNNKKLPNDAVIESLPYYNGESLKDFLEVIKNEGLLRGNVSVDEELHYNGKVYALTDGYSASATEPISYFLKQHKLATLVGEKTAGGMLSSTFITVKDDWTVVLPVADYYTSDRFRIEQKGVKPNIKVKSDDALEYVLKIIAQ